MGARTKAPRARSGQAGAKDPLFRPTPTAPGYGDFGDDPLAALRRMDLFRGLSGYEFEQLAKIAEIVRIPQDRILPRAIEPRDAAFFFVLKGLVAFAEFDQGKVPGPPDPKRRPPAVMQLARRNLTLFEVNDFFTNEHVEYVRGDRGEQRDVALYTGLPVTLIKLEKAALDRILASVPRIREAVDARAEASYYRNSFLKLENRSHLLDFYAREGLAYAQAIKVIQTDKCIDCDECVKACEDRHGIARIERFGPSVGRIQFTLNCRTCFDARCIPECNFDAIGFDESIGEVVIYDNCVGCTKCAKGCPHEAIRMVDMVAAEDPAIDIVQMAKDRAEEKPKTVIANGEEASKEKKSKKPKRIANKCDHCLGYSDMACISACPTGAIIQIDPRELFRRDGGMIERADRYFDPKPFVEGYAQVAKTQGVGVMRLLFVVVGIGVFGAVLEFASRKYGVLFSPFRELVRLLVGERAANTMLLTYSPAVGFGRWLGYLGAGMMTVAALYTLRLHLPGIRRVGNSRTWFDFHVVFGLAGPALSLMHTGLNVFEPRWVTFLWWAVFLVVLTGLVGRYLYTALPAAEFATEKAREQLDEGIKRAADQWASMTMSANVLQHFLKAQEKTAEVNQGKELGMFAFLGAMIVSEFRRSIGAIKVRTKLLGQMRDKKLRRTAIQLMSQRASVERRTQFLGAARRLLARWRAFHIGITIVMFVLLAAHVSISIWAMGL